MLLAKISNLLLRSEGSKPEPESRSGDSMLTKQRLMVAMLLFRFVRSDGRAKMIELIHMSELLRKDFSLTQTELERLFEVVDRVGSDATSTDQLLNEASADLDSRDRIKLLEYLWVLAYADDIIDGAEAEQIKLLAGKLKLTLVQQAQAQENAENHLGL